MQQTVVFCFQNKMQSKFSCLSLSLPLSLSLLSINIDWDVLAVNLDSNLKKKVTREMIFIFMNLMHFI